VRQIAQREALGRSVKLRYRDGGRFNGAPFNQSGDVAIHHLDWQGVLDDKGRRGAWLPSATFGNNL